MSGHHNKFTIFIHCVCICIRISHNTPSQYTRKRRHCKQEVDNIGVACVVLWYQGKANP